MINNNKNKMIMKKNYLLIAAAAAMFAACSSNDTFKEINVEENEAPIAFTTYSEKLTRADNSTATTYDGLSIHHDDFSVWGFKYGKYGANDANAWAAVWGRGDGNIATGTVSYSSSWTASPAKFWDKAATKYYFYAAAPASNSWVLNVGTSATDEDDNYLTYTDFVVDGTNALSSATTTYSETFKPASGTSQDLLIAENKQVDRSSSTYNQANPAAVQLLFDHILSRLNITVKKSDGLSTAGVTVDITGFTITAGDLCNKGSFDESKTVSTSGTIARWANVSPASPSIDGTYTLAAGKTIDNLTTTATYIGQYLIIPQNITREVLDRAAPVLLSDGSTAATHPYFKIEYELNDEPFYAYYDLADAFNVATLAFNEGYQNTLNITIDADAIVFDPQVYKWVDNPANLIEVE